METHALEAEKPFARSTALFTDLVGSLRPELSGALDHAALENMLEIKGRELCRQLLQDHLTLRAAKETVREVTDAQAELRTHIRSADRNLMTLFGPVHISRLSYGGRGLQSLRPMDRDLNLPATLFSFGVQQRVATEAAKSSFGETQRTIEATTGAHVAHRQTEEITVAAAQNFDAFYQSRLRLVSSASELLVVSADGKGIVMRQSDLRVRTQTEACERSHKMKHRLSKGEKRNCKRMATVAAVYEIDRWERTAADIVADLKPRDSATPPRRPRPVNKRVWASIAKPAEHVLEEAIEEALKRDPERKKTWVFLTDGNKPQIRHLRQLARKHRVDATMILDVIHVLGYLWAASYCFHPEGTKEAEQWVTKRFTSILEGHASAVAAGIRSSATKRRLDKDRRKAADACAAYLLANRELLRYEHALANGLPIATGVIEGACRHLIKDRMDITGARWSLQGAEAILRLRSLRSSGDFEAYWAFHLKQELRRNHTRHYHRGEQPLAAAVLTMPARQNRRR